MATSIAIALLVAGLLAWKYAGSYVGEIGRRHSSPAQGVAQMTQRAAQVKPTVSQNAAPSHYPGLDPRPENSPASTPDLHESPPTRRDDDSSQRDSNLPAQLSLRDGEQKLFLDGDLIVGVVFNRVGTVEFPTLRVSTNGEPPRNLALLSGPETLELLINERKHLLTILRIDNATRTLVIRLD